MEHSCAACGSLNLQWFSTETNIHLPARRDSVRASVFAFPTLLLCLDCGSIRANVSENDLQTLRKRINESGDSSSAAA
jgi:hypothetical protein